MSNLACDEIKPHMPVIFAMEIQLLKNHLERCEAEIQRLRGMIPGEKLLCSTYKDSQGGKFNYAQVGGVKRWIINRVVRWMVGV